jgi:hypothetical protein
VRDAFSKLRGYPRVRFGLAHDERGRLRDPRFVSFLAQSNRKLVNTDLQDALLRLRVLLRRGALVAAGLAAAWIVVESAKALSVF